ncbi:MAG TPA: Ig-like domain-containing protein, partial [Candidatus Saccharimonadia bacterium]|nr:Ig-like domain-containing protein [Candidatus Saccharimonadia bacterium]
LDKGARAKSFDGASVAPGVGATFGDKWGSSVATDGTTVVAGATEADDAADEDGYVTVISGVGGGGGFATSDTIEAPTDDASSASDEQGFGAAVDIDGGTLVVGAPQTDSANDNTGVANSDEGTAYTFAVADGTASGATTVAAPSGAPGDKWGTSVAVSAGTVASGGPGTDVSNSDGTSSPDQGAVITFECEVDEVGASDCDYDQTMFGKDAEDGEGIGSAIAFDGEEFVVGAPDADATGLDAGAIYTGADLFSSAAVAVNDTAFMVAEDSSANNLDVLANDTGDLESGAKTVIGVGIATNGTASVAPRGASVRYTPNFNYCGPDSFTYSLDGGSVATVTLTVTCIDDAGVAVDDAPAAIGEDAGTATFAVLANDTDVDGGSSVTADTTATGGTTAVGANGANVTFTPSLDFCGPTSFGYTITGNDTATVSVTVTCVNDAPIAVGTIANRSAAEGENASFATAASFADVDDASLSYSATGLPAGLSISPTTGVISGAIAAGASSQSPYAVTITARDAANAQAIQSFQYTVTAPPPGGDLIFGSSFEG